MGVPSLKVWRPWRTSRTLENVKETFRPYGGMWLVLDDQVEVLEGA